MCNREISSRRIDRFFSAKLYDHQGPIARGGRTNPAPDRPCLRNALIGRGALERSPPFDLEFDLEGQSAQP